MTNDFLERHPDWIERYGELARIRGIEDARFHIEFLIGALLSGSPEEFARYARWTDGVLRSRGIDSEFLIENLIQVREHAGARFDEAGRKQIALMVDAGVRALRDDTDPAAGEVYAGERAIYLQAVLAGDRDAALNIAGEALRGGASVIDVYQDMIQPAQYEIGRLWQGNTISVASEHTATAITSYVIARLHQYFPPPTTRRGNAVVTGVQNELHQLGAQMVANVLEGDGWTVRFLGSHLPHRDIVATVVGHGAQLVGISAATLPQLDAVASLIDDLRARCGPDLRIIVGGHAFAGAPDAWHDLGADALGTDLRSTCELARAVTGRG